MQVNKELKQKLDQNSIGKIEILAMLTRLRQICCDPRLVFEGITTPSSKLPACIDLVNTLHENNKKILIFSSFTSLMDLLAQELDKQKLPLLYANRKYKQGKTKRNGRGIPKR